MIKSQISWLLREGVNTIRYEGIHILFWRMLRWGLHPLGDLRAITFCRKDLTQPLEEKHASIDLTICPATEADIDRIAELTELRWSEQQKKRLFKEKSIKETIVQRFNQGNICFLGKVGLEVVHYNWIFFHKMDYNQYYLLLRSSEALCDDGFTHPNWRGKGVHGAVNNQMLRYLQRSGIRTAYTNVESDNLSSKKGLRRVGWDCYGSLVYFDIYGSKKIWMWQIHPPLDPFIPMKSTQKGGDTIS